MSTRPWSPSWKRFLETHARWWRRVSPSGPVYWVPEKVVPLLSEAAEDDAVRKRRAHTALITPEDAAAENEFRRVCTGYSRETVGVWDEQPLNYALLNAAPIETDVPEDLLEEWAAAGVRTTAVRASLAAVAPRVDQLTHQLLGYVGRLTFNEQYRQDRLRLENQWSQVPTRPPLNVGSGTLLGPPRSSAEIRDRSKAPPSVAEFYDALAAFCQRWDLANLVTWDLPLPQAPLEMATAGLVSRLRGPDESVTHGDLPSRHGEGLGDPHAVTLLVALVAVLRRRRAHHEFARWDQDELHAD